MFWAGRQAGGESPRPAGVHCGKNGTVCANPAGRWKVGVSHAVPGSGNDMPRVARPAANAAGSVSAQNWGNSSGGMGR